MAGDPYKDLVHEQSER